MLLGHIAANGIRSPLGQLIVIGVAANPIGETLDLEDEVLPIFVLRSVTDCSAPFTRVFASFARVSAVSACDCARSALPRTSVMSVDSRPMSCVLRREVSSNSPARCSSGVTRSLMVLRAYFLVAHPPELNTTIVVKIIKIVSLFFIFSLPLLVRM